MDKGPWSLLITLQLHQWASSTVTPRHLQCCSVHFTDFDVLWDIALSMESRYKGFYFWELGSALDVRVYTIHRTDSTWEYQDLLSPGKFLELLVTTLDLPFTPWGQTYRQSYFGQIIQSIWYNRYIQGESAMTFSPLSVEISRSAKNRLLLGLLYNYSTLWSVFWLFCNMGRIIGRDRT